jgi:hypothetical protein
MSTRTYQVPARSAEVTIVAHVTTNTAEWLLEIGGLTVGCREGASTDVVGQGMALAAQVRAAAASWAAQSSCTVDRCTDDCPLAALDGGRAACRLAHQLAPTADSSLTQLRPRRAAARYLQALQAASGAVFHCRRLGHPVGECWFSGRFADGATEVCGDVLAVAHRVGH